MFMFVSGGSGWVAKALMDEFEDPTSSSLIDRLEVIQGSTDNAQPLFSTNHQYRELIQQMGSHFEVHKQKYHQISTSAVTDVLGKMEAKTFTQIGAALFFRALLTCIGRIHLERMNTNGYPNQLVDKKTKERHRGIKSLTTSQVTFCRGKFPGHILVNSKNGYSLLIGRVCLHSSMRECNFGVESFMSKTQILQTIPSNN